MFVGIKIVFPGQTQSQSLIKCAHRLDRIVRFKGVDAVAIQNIKLENEGWERDYEVTEPKEPSFLEPA